MENTADLRQIQKKVFVAKKNVNVKNASVTVWFDTIVKIGNAWKLCPSALESCVFCGELKYSLQ